MRRDGPAVIGGRMMRAVVLLLATATLVVRAEFRAPGPCEELIIDPNRATAAELQVLPGIGPALADAIVAERANGRFHSLDDLTRVRRIGPVIVERITPWVRITDTGAR